MTTPDHTITPGPTDAEAAAIVAALQAMLAQGAPDDDEITAVDPGWRFSGRWWNRPVAQARQRPWRR